MGREEQIEEREVLDSIFPDEIEGTPLLSRRPRYPPIPTNSLLASDISETSYRVSIALDVPDQPQGDSDEDEEHESRTYARVPDASKL